MIKLNDKNVFKTTEHGATILEFALSILLIFGVIGIIIQIGIAAYQYTSMRYSIHKVVRSLSVNGGGSNICLSNLTVTAKSNAETMLQSIGLGDGGVSVSILPAITAIQLDSFGNAHTVCTLGLKATKASDCFFCNIFGKTISNLEVRRIQWINDECVNCNC